MLQVEEEGGTIVGTWPGHEMKLHFQYLIKLHIDLQSELALYCSLCHTRGGFLCSLIPWLAGRLLAFSRENPLVKEEREVAMVECARSPR